MMFKYRALRLALFAMMLVLVAPAAAMADYGLFIYPVSLGARDNGPHAAVALGKSLQKDGLVNDMVEVSTAQQFINLMNQMTQQGKKIDRLVITSHGAAGDPGLQLGPDRDGSIMADDVNLDLMQTQLDGLREGRDRQLKNGTVSPQTQKMIDETEQQIARFQSIGQAMAPGAQVLLVNCDAAGSDKGLKFIDNLGSLLLPQGGTLIASSTRVAVGEIEKMSDPTGIRLLNLLTGKKTYTSDKVLLGGNFKTFTFYGNLSGRWEERANLGTHPVVIQSGGRQLKAIIGGFPMQASWTGRRLRGTLRLKTSADVMRFVRWQHTDGAKIPPTKTIDEAIRQNGGYDITWDLLARSPTQLVGHYQGMWMNWGPDGELQSLTRSPERPCEWVKQK